MNSNYQHPLTLPATDAAPEESKTILEGVKKKFGFVPNLMTAFSPSPAVLEAYLVIADLVSKTSFTPKEQHAGALIISQELGCHYCLAAHGTLGQSLGLDKETIVALQTRAPLNDRRLEALRTLLLSLLETKGHPEAEAIQTFKDAGYTDTQIGEAVLLVTWKTLSNYTNHLYDTPIDEAFKINAAPCLVCHQDESLMQGNHQAKRLN
jgi:AhpD family alkylhydroperoxidase